MTQPSEAETFAAVDLGSNSFHMVIARNAGPELRILDRVRERVRLAGGLEGKRLSDDVQERALECLERMGQRVRHLLAHNVRAVGTNTLRRAKNSRKFLKKARKALGHPIQVISGQEEARLIYLGVAHHNVTDPAGRRLVVDIGGGSTECILGEGFDVLKADSLHMGCVSFSRKHFPDGELKKGNLRRAVIAARLELRTLERPLQALGWDACVGASGTVNAIAEVLKVNGWSEGGITGAGLRKLRKAMLAAGHVDKLTKIDGLKPERAPVLAGGFAILKAVFDSLDVECMETSGGALREGVLYDLVGRVRHEGVRGRTISRFVERFNVDLEHAARVEETALQLLDRVREPWELGDPAKRLLVWAARLHEIGLVVSYNGYHRHGSYLIENSFMPGFSNDTQQQLATLVRMHRRKVPSDSVELPDYAPLGVTGLLRLSVLLRLAVLLNRSRSPEPQPTYFLEADVGKLRLTFEEDWLEENALTRADLEREAAILQQRGFELTVE